MVAATLFSSWLTSKEKAGESHCNGLSSHVDPLVTRVEHFQPFIKDATLPGMGRGKMIDFVEMNGCRTHFGR